MATLQGMSGVDVRACVAEMRRLIPLWVNKVYSYDGKTLSFRLNGEEHAKHQLLIEAGRRIHLTSHVLSPPKIPPQFAMLLRKYISGGRVLDIRQHGIQRIVTLDIRKSDQIYHLVIELFDEGNVVLCAEDFLIVKPLWHHRFRDREVVPGVTYTYPPCDPTTFTEVELSAFFSGEERSIVKSLAVGCMLGGAYAEFVCRDAHIDKQAPAPSVDAHTLYTSIQRLLQMVEHAESPVITTKGCTPVMLGDAETVRTFATYNEALDSYYPLPSRETKGEDQKRPILSRGELIRKQQEAAIRKFEAQVAHAEKCVEKIYEHYTLVNDVISSLGEASRRMSWQEIEKVLSAQSSGSAAHISAVHPADASVDLDLGGEKIDIRVHESIEVNLGRYFDMQKKWKRKIAGARAAMEKPVEKRAAKRPATVLAKKRWFQRFRWFYTSDNVLVIGGRDASQNEELVKRYMEGGDTFVHADVHGASVVIVKGTTTHMEEAAQFAASYSGAWRSGHFSADVYAARPDQVSKTPEAGEYITRGSFIVRGERIWYKNVPLAVGIGLQQVPELSIIGGPPGTVRLRAKVWIEITPGRFEPNDAAKKVLRALKEKVGQTEAGMLARILNTEQVAGFVPPGGSDIVGIDEG
jgi:predicted ribosome quality control (RQC) complex YloA/Tae2 family protein